MRSCVLLGSRSDIGRALGMALIRDGWGVHGWHRHGLLPSEPWDLALCAIGTVAPVGLWYDTDAREWADGLDANLLLPIALLRRIWPHRKADATVCFLAGSNPQKVFPGYSSYNASKMALLKVVEQMDAETPGAKFFGLGPGYIPTKIHSPTIAANWPNERIAKGGGTPIEKVYDCLRWAIAQPKAVIGGRNICASDPYDSDLAGRLYANPSLFKLRRVE